MGQPIRAKGREMLSGQGTRASDRLLTTSCHALHPFLQALEPSAFSLRTPSAVSLPPSAVSLSLPEVVHVGDKRALVVLPDECDESLDIATTEGVNHEAVLLLGLHHSEQQHVGEEEAAHAVPPVEHARRHLLQHRKA